MERSLEYLLSKLNLNTTGLCNIDLLKLGGEVVKKDVEYHKLKSIESLGHYLSGDNLEYDYNELVEASENGFGDNLASEYVSVWEPLENYSVDDILDLI